MSEQVTIDGKEYISSKRAAELSGYAQDYIGQLARGAQIDAQRIGGLWFVFMPSLEEYKTKAEAYKPEPPVRVPNADPDSLLTFDGKDYISAARASKITGYHQDYVGQLARAGTVLSRQVGNRWYVEREGISAHKKEKDALLAAMQTESVGLARSVPSSALAAAKQSAEPLMDDYFTYTNDTRDLTPSLTHENEPSIVSEPSEDIEVAHVPIPIPVRVISRQEVGRRTSDQKKTFSTGAKTRSRIPGKTIFYAAGGVMVVTIVIVLMFGLSRGVKSSMYAGAGSTPYTASAVRAYDALGNYLEQLFVPELTYKRAQ